MAVIGKQRITSFAAAGGLTVPAGTKAAKISLEAQNVRYQVDGTDPTTSIGHLLYAGAEYNFNRSSGLDAMKIIELAASAIVNVTYYNARVGEVGGPS